MKAARILVLAVALAAGGAAAFLIGSDEEQKPEAPPPVAQIEDKPSAALALRSLLDASKVGEEDDRKPEINTVRFGVSTK
jgi:hypothetical protein